MKVVRPKEMQRIEKEAYASGASEELFMQQAGEGIAEYVDAYINGNQKEKHVILLCGKGNNAGDAYVVGRRLLEWEYEVIAFQLVPIEECSPLCQKQHGLFLERGGAVHSVQSIDDCAFPRDTVYVDGIFGTGFQGSIREPYASIIEAVNVSGSPVIAVDIPSGLNGATGEVEGAAIRAVETVYLGLPKTGFFLRHGLDQTGVLRYVNFGLGEEFIDRANADYLLVTSDRVRPFLPPIQRTRHKYSAGHVVALAGSPPMPGAAILAVRASLRGGAGILHLLYPQEMRGELAQLPPEIIRIPYTYDALDPVISWLNRATACFVGPGLGRDATTANMLAEVLPKVEKPVVIDGDALTLIAERGIPIPKRAILTPQTGEMHRLLQEDVHGSTVDASFLQACQRFAEKHQIALVLKGAATFLFYPDEPILVNATSDPGMATAGSGDVLTGLIAALLAQGLSPHRAATLGVHLHGFAGVCAAEEKTSYCMIASDILEHLPEAFRL